MKCLLFALLALGLLAGATGKAEADYIFTTVDFPGSAGTSAFGINNGGQIVGDYMDPVNPNLLHGFLLSGGSYTNLDRTVTASAINNLGQIVGGVGNSGYLYSARTYTTFTG